jgi:hypothetical protein
MDDRALGKPRQVEGLRACTVANATTVVLR